MRVGADALITLKQAEAFHWVGKLGGVVDAAERLHLAQSTVSKRVLELEATLGATLFERSGRAVRLTRVGRSLVPLATDLLAAELRFREAVVGAQAFAGAFRFGVTELVALSWLPRLILAMREEYPNVTPEPEVDTSARLFQKLGDHRLDLVIGLDPPAEPDFVAVPLGKVTLQWACAPGTGPERAVVPLAEIAQYPILTQGEGSGLQRLVIDWVHNNGVSFNRTVKCNSLSVLTELAASGLVVTFVAEPYLSPQVGRGRLRMIRTVPAIPPIQYFAVSRRGAVDALAASVAQIAHARCDFSLDQFLLER